MMNKTMMLAAGLLGAAMLVPMSATAATVNDYALSPLSPIEGNDCSGVLGTSPTCEDLNGSPQIIKIDFEDDGSIKEISINPLFSSIDGSEFSFDFGDDDSTGTGTWYYTPDDATDPGITSFTAKGGRVRWDRRLVEFLHSEQSQRKACWSVAYHLL
jgi:hypothetical protein